jgi:hypothetical protein
MKRFVILTLLGILMACGPDPKEAILTREDSKVWLLAEMYNVSQEGDTSGQINYGRATHFDSPRHSFNFLKFENAGVLKGIIFENRGEAGPKTQGVWSLKGNTISLLADTSIENTSHYNPEWQLNEVQMDRMVIWQERGALRNRVHEVYIPRHLPYTPIETTTIASPGAMARGLSTKTISAAEFEAKRLALITINPDSLDLPWTSYTSAVGMVVELFENGKHVLIHADTKGKTTIYYSDGTVQQGGENLLTLQIDGKKLGGESMRLWENMQPQKSTAAVTEGFLRFYVIHSSGTGEVFLPISRAKNAGNDYAILYHAARRLLDNYNEALLVL